MRYKYPEAYKKAMRILSEVKQIKDVTAKQQAAQQIRDKYLGEFIGTFEEFNAHNKYDQQTQSPTKNTKRRLE